MLKAKLSRLSAFANSRKAFVFGIALFSALLFAASLHASTLQLTGTMGAYTWQGQAGWFGDTALMIINLVTEPTIYIVLSLVFVVEAIVLLKSGRWQWGVFLLALTAMLFYAVEIVNAVVAGTGALI